mgnify:CR=1 FL=1
MKFVIKHEIRGRIRVQILQGRMSIEQADILQYYFNAKPYSISVKVRERLSEIVIHYDGDRETVVRDLQIFSYEKAEVPESYIQNSGRALNSEYWEKLMTRVIMRAGNNLFLPAGIRAVITSVKSVKYIWKGICTLAARKIEVPVLDATAIGVSIIRSDFDTAGSVMFLLGIGEILEEWTAWRTDCVKRRVYFILNKKKEKLHLLQGLKRILLDIDRAIQIIRETEEEAEVIPNLMIGFGIDQVQAEYVAEIKLRNINKEYILKRVAETSALQDEIEDLEDTLAKPGRIRKIIIGELEDVKKKYAVPRRTEIVYSHEMPEEPDEEPVEDYPVHLFLSREGYFKKITPQSLRMSGEQKFKEGDSLRQYFEAANSTELLLFTDKCQVYKSRASEFGETKASALGDYLPAKLGMDAGENVIWLCLPGDYSGSVVFFFENGRAARVALSAYATVSNRRKLTGAYCDKFPLVCAVYLTEDTELALETNEPRALLVHTALLSPKTTRSTQGVQVMNIKPKYRLEKVLPAVECGIVNGARYRTRTIPAAGALLKPEDSEEKQLELL